MITYYKVNHKNVLDYASFPTFVLCFVYCVVVWCCCMLFN